MRAGFSALFLFMEAAFEEILRPPSLHHCFAISCQLDGSVGLIVMSDLVLEHYII